MLSLCFEGLQPFFEPADARFGFGFIEITFGIAINQARNALAQLRDLLVQPGRIGLTRRCL